MLVVLSHSGLFGTTILWFYSD